MIRGLILLAAAAGHGAWLDVPHVQQSEAGCGSAAVAMVVQYWARQNPALEPAALATERISDELRPAKNLGLHGAALKAWLERNGFQAFVFSGGVEDLRHHLEKGRPVIVCIGSRGVRGPLHYQVVVGFEDDAIWVNDPARGKLVREPPSSFLASWKTTGFWALLAVPRQRP